MASGDFGEAAKSLLSGKSDHLKQLITAIVMAVGFLLGFLPIYTNFMDRLGGYDKHFAVIDDKIEHIEKNVSSIEADVRTGNTNTQQRLDSVLANLAATRELILTLTGKQGTK